MAIKLAYVVARQEQTCTIQYCQVQEESMGLAVAVAMSFSSTSAALDLILSTIKPNLQLPLQDNFFSQKTSN